MWTSTWRLTSIKTLVLQIFKGRGPPFLALPTKFWSHCMQINPLFVFWQILPWLRTFYMGSLLCRRPCLGYLTGSNINIIILCKNTFSFWGASPPRPPISGLCPDTPLGAQPPNPHIFLFLTAPAPLSTNHGSAHGLYNYVQFFNCPYSFSWKGL